MLIVVVVVDLFLPVRLMALLSLLLLALLLRVVSSL